MSDVLRRLGLDAEDDEHPANTDVLRRLGIEPADDEHPATRRADSYGLGDPTRTITSPPSKTMLQKLHEAIDPWTVVPAVAKDIGSNIVDSATSSARMAGEGLSEAFDGKPASGVGKAALGTLGVGLSPLTGTVKSGENLLASVTGNPSFAERAAMVAPINVGGPAMRTAAHNIHPTTRGADEVARIVGPENIPAMLERLKSNPRLRPIDTNDQLRMAGQGMISSPGSPDASRTLTQSMRESAAGARDAVRGTYDSKMGAPPNLFEETQRLENRAKAIGQAKIAPPLITAGPVDTSNLLADIDKALNPAAVKMTPGTTIQATPLQQRLAEFRHKIATDTEVLTDASRLHSLQSGLRREAEDLMASMGSDKKLGRELMDYRNKLVDSIDKAAPGYKEGLAAYRDQKDIQRAFEFGRDVLKNTDDIKTDPSFLEQWIKSKDRTKEEIEAARLGARVAVEKKMGSIKASALDPARSGTDVPQIEFNRKKLEHLFGKENTDVMFKHLSDERDIALTNNRGLGNSKTAETQSWQKHLEPRDISRPTSNLPGWALAMGAGTGALSGNPTLGAIAGGTLLGARSAKAGYDWLARRGDVRRNNAIADIITRNDPETRALLSVAAQRVGQRNKLQNLIAPP